MSAPQPAPGGVAGDPTMTREQLGAVVICLVLNLIDGFDVLAVAFAAPALSADWKLPPEALGALLSAGLLGMTAGSLVLAPLADRHGRRALTLLSLVLVTAGMLGAAATRTTSELTAARVLTGLGIGAMLPSLNTIVAEHAPARHRELALSLMSTGYPIGATLGGTAAIFVAARFGWRGIFVLGGIASTLMIPIVLWGLREPPRPAAAASSAHAVRAVRARELLAGGLRGSTLLLWLAFFCVMFVFYFVMSWTPKLLVEAGLTPDKGLSGGVLLNVGGIAGIVVLGVVARRLGLFRVHAAALVCAAAAIYGFGLVSGAFVPALVLATLVGFFLFVSMVGLYVITPAIYPAAVRNTGTGLAIGVGRIGGIASPYLAGVLLSSGLPPGQAYMAFGIPLLIGAVATAALARASARPSIALA